MKDYCIIDLEAPTPIVAAAIHNGHKLGVQQARLTALTEMERFREEDPFTGIWTEITGNQIVGQRSRFEFDLNRSPEKAVYVLPSDAWGLHLWKKPLSKKLTDKTLQQYTSIYQEIYKGLARLIESFGKIVILDLHSYNHRRGGPEAVPDDPALNPEINIGTGTMDRAYWAPVVDRFISDLGSYEFRGKKWDIRENVKFRGGHFPSWVHGTFGKSACCISVEVKKIFMDEWTGSPDWEVIEAIKEALAQTLQGLTTEITKIKTILNQEDKLL